MLSTSLIRIAVFFLALALTDTPELRAQGTDDGKVLSPIWLTETESGIQGLKLYFFYSETCGHCEAAAPIVRRIAEERPWLELEALAIDQGSNVRSFFMLAREFGREPEAIPTFFICGEMLVGFDEAMGTGAEIANIADDCHARLVGEAAAPARGVRDETQEAFQVDLPVVGDVDLKRLSLPVLTITLAGLDAFNPCAFFVLLSLLSLMVHAKSRARIAVVGGVFVLISGLMYFVFMTAWLNFFMLVQNVDWITTAAGGVALAIGALGIKDYLAMGQGPSLSIPASAKPGLFERMRHLISVQNIAALLLGTGVLAIAANSYELLCTSGFPLVYTRLLTLHDLSHTARYTYLALYNLVYVIPLLFVVIVFVATLGSRKLTENEGRTLKLLSGLLMSGMGITLIVAPDVLHNVLAALGLLVAALTLSVVIKTLDRPRRGIEHK